MKYIILILLGFVFAFSTEKKKVNVDFKFLLCDKNLIGDTPTFKVVDEKNKVVQVILYHEENKQIQLSPGAYTVYFNSYFDEYETQKILVDRRDYQEITICFDQFSKKNDTRWREIPFDNMEFLRSYQIKVISRGCFHHSKDSLKIEYDHDNSYQLFYNERTIQLEGKDSVIYRNFERILFNANLLQGGCTTMDQYFIKFDGSSEWMPVAIDMTCKWEGFIYLKWNLIDKH